MMTRNGSQGLRRTKDIPWCGFRVALVLLTAAAAWGATAPAALVVHTETGLRIAIHSSETIVEHWIVRKNGRTYFQHPTAGSVELETQQFPWSDLVPADPEEVAAALSAMHGFRTDLQVDVFMLPGLPAEILTSFALRQAIFMAPGLGRQHPQTVAYVATHEMGHVLSWAAVDGRFERWQAYRSLRGLAPQTGDLTRTPHAELHAEIIAEDMRYLFGGELATRIGSIENSNIPLPDSIPGLAELLAGFVGDLGWPGIQEHMPSQVFPNPSCDVVRVELLVDQQTGKHRDHDPILEVYDVRGRLVRRLAGGILANGRITVTWDGCLCDGRRAADGPYLYRIQGAGHVGSGRMILLSR
jgi:hypothetical protein